MYIRRTTIKSRGTAEPYFTYRLVESVRTPDGARQRKLLNLGCHFDVSRDQWGTVTQRIEQLLSAQRLSPSGRRNDDSAVLFRIRNAATTPIIRCRLLAGSRILAVFERAPRILGGVDDSVKWFTP
jgi:hypothetical protein